VSETVRGSAANFPCCLPHPPDDGSVLFLVVECFLVAAEDRASVDDVD
jgi:hypothetical protein